ncbi:MAG: TrkA family potassium uptake protein [Clostridia bacterium]|nr:TrkA family potassium uptake protein [Clostridia bacterium]
MKSVLLIGVGEFGQMLAEELNKLGHQIMAVDLSEERVNAVLPYVTDAQIGDSTDEQFLDSLGVANFDVCFVTISQDFRSSIETTFLLKERGARRVVTRSDRKVQKQILLRNGADDVIHPKAEMASWAAVRYTGNNISDYIELDDENSIYEIPVPEDWDGKTVAEVNLRGKYGINILGFKKGDRLDSHVMPDTVFEGGRGMLVIGETKALQKCFKI